MILRLNFCKLTVPKAQKPVKVSGVKEYLSMHVIERT